MKTGILGVALLALAAAAAAEELPVAGGKKLVASVQGEPITLDELNAQLAGTPRPQPAAQVLRRMINVILVAQEARRMGLDTLPEIKRSVDSYARLALREELVDGAVKDVKADPALVEEQYRAATREWTVTAVLFAAEEHARAFGVEVAAGRAFADAAQAALAAGKATRLEERAVVRREAADPTVAQALAAMTVGAVSPPVASKAGHVVLRLDEVRYRDDPAARATAERIVVTAARREAVARLDEALKKKYVKINRPVLSALDYEADRPGIDALLKDRRVVAEVKGEAPVTVAELTEELKFQFFHGTTLAAERKRLNAKKEQTLDALLHRKVFRKEALRLRLDRTDAYRAKVKDFERSVLFEALLRRAIVPDVKLVESDLRAYYDEHRDQYTTPQMMRLRSLPFAGRPAAEAALATLRTGADFQWVADHAEGQLPPGTKDLLTFDTRPIMTSELPDGVQKAVAGARPGDVRLYAAAEDRVYVVAVQDVVAAEPRPYEDVRQEIARRVLDARIEKAVEDFADKLRGLSDVKVYLKAS